MMASREWAILAKARWLRKGGKSAFIKFIIPAARGAGPDTEWITGNSRLKQLEQRLLALRELGERIPLVPLLEVRLSERGLLIAMEEITPLQDKIERGGQRELSLKVLECLDPMAERGADWFHFDICPNNIGVLPSGRCVLIDVESLYLREDACFSVTVPAWKSFRAPSFLANEVADALAARGRPALPGFDVALAQKKTCYEVALAAAECVLGPLRLAERHLSESGLAQWVADSDDSDPVVLFWRQQLHGLVTGAQTPSIQALAQEMRQVLSSNRQVVPSPRSRQQVNFPNNRLEVLPPTQEVVSAVLPQSQMDGWEAEWKLIQPRARALRAGRLGYAEVADYKLMLEQLSVRYPDRREVWDELLLLSISYLKDPAVAEWFVKSALERIPGDLELERQKTIIQNWAAERRNVNT
ncbi:hypothetical protein [Myxococcus eversor]|uniref:hypothetical protein n=1 Tax=Myxococcus eversor TaxID=2709661 RepID=UPI001967DD06|nr:hypothetical protein [Myxococcus eversor]